MDAELIAIVQDSCKTVHGGLSMLIIDPQVDFHPNGSLAVENANNDSAKIADFIDKNISEISQINVTLDSHQRCHIAHAVFWTNKEGKSPEPFTLIPASDIENGVWFPKNQNLTKYAVFYAKRLEKDGRFVLCIWPEHCLMGTPGHAVVPAVNKAILKWAKCTGRDVNYVMKGTNSLTEHYSALRADVELPNDPATQLNTKLISTLRAADRVLICGEALSHCVNFTTRDLANNWPKEELHKLTILTDCASPVGGFESNGETFLKDMREKGLTLMESTSIFTKFTGK